MRVNLHQLHFMMPTFSVLLIYPSKISIFVDGYFFHMVSFGSFFSSLQEKEQPDVFAHSNLLFVLITNSCYCGKSFLAYCSFVCGAYVLGYSIAYELFLAVDKCNFGFVHSEGFASFVFVEYTDYGSRLEVVAISYDGTKEYEAAV